MDLKLKFNLGNINSVIKKKENIILQVSQVISSPENLQSPDKGMKLYKSSSQQNKLCFAPNIQASQERTSNQTRESVIIKNNDTFLKRENSVSKTTFLITEYEHSVINDGKILKRLLVCPTFSELYLHSKEIKKAYYLCNEGLIFKETRNDPESEMEISSESENEITSKILLRFEPEILFSEDEKHQLDKLVIDHDSVYQSVNFGEVLIKEMLMCSMFGVAMSMSAAIQGYRLQVERITRIANSIKCFTNLQKDDQVALLKENADLFVSLCGAIFFDKNKKGVDQVMSSIGKGVDIFCIKRNSFCF